MSDITPDMVLQDLQTQMDNYAEFYLQGDVHDADRLITKAANVLRWFEERAIIVTPQPRSPSLHSLHTPPSIPLSSQSACPSAFLIK